MLIILQKADWDTLTGSIGMLSIKIDNLYSMISRNFEQEKQAMSAISDAVAKVSADLDALGTSLDNDSLAIQGAIAALSGSNPDVATAVTALEALDTRVHGYATKLDDNTAALNAAHP